MGNVLSAGIGQAPARQAALEAGLSASCVCTTVNKVCSSGLKAIIMAVQEIQLGASDVVVAGGMENMSLVPYYVNQVRFGTRMGDRTLVDGMMKDGLLDPHGDVHMGMFAERCADVFSFSRKYVCLSILLFLSSEFIVFFLRDSIFACRAIRFICFVGLRSSWHVQPGLLLALLMHFLWTTFVFLTSDQDQHAAESYRRSNAAKKSGVFAKEIVAVSVPSRKGAVVVADDEEISRTDVTTLPTHRPAFIKDGTGTVTAGNASPLSDGAAALVLMSEAKAQSLGIKPIARVLGYGDAEQEPQDFTTAPSVSIPRALLHANVSQDQVDLFEINEAFSVVALANMKLLDVEASKLNIHGGAVSLGHPLGCSGARILVSLITAMTERKAQLGAAGICNGGGGSSAIVIQRD
jgi:acetyl-CoA acetyltransferase